MIIVIFFYIVRGVDETFALTPLAHNIRKQFVKTTTYCYRVGGDCPSGSIGANL
jgi:hypothetical protein